MTTERDPHYDAFRGIWKRQVDEGGKEYTLITQGYTNMNQDKMRISEVSHSRNRVEEAHLHFPPCSGWTNTLMIFKKEVFGGKGIWELIVLPVCCLASPH